MKQILVILSTALLTSCVMPPPSAYWYKQGVSQQDVQTKYSHCVYNVGMNKVDLVQQQTLINACMEADGFRWGVQNNPY